jgi:hypothetical protein
MGGRDIVLRRTQEANRQGWKCHWCKQPMTPVPSFPPGGPTVGQKYPPTMVTLEHLYGKNDPRRLRDTKRGEKRWFAACKACNERRGREHEKEFPSLAHRLAMKARQRKAQQQRHEQAKNRRFTNAQPVSTGGPQQAND